MLGIGGIGLLVILFFLMNNGNFFGNNQTATSNEVQRGFDNQNSMANQREILGAVNAGTAQTVAATNQTFHDMLGALDQRYGEVIRDIGDLRMAQQQAIANQNECCCSTKLAMEQGFASIREKLDANKIEALQAQVAQLQMQNLLTGVVKFPNQATYTMPFPFPPQPIV